MSSPNIKAVPPLRIANVAYLNSAPYRAVRDLSNIEYHEVAPVECARMLHEDEVDLALIPIAETLAYGSYDILPYGIAALKAVDSVLLLSEVPVEQLETIYVDNSSQTSVMLLRVLLEELHPRTGDRLRFHRAAIGKVLDRIHGKTGVLIIGDQALRLRDRFAHSMDLASAWHMLTGLPFVFAAWAYRPERISKERLEEVSAAFRLGVSQRKVFAREWAEETEYDRDRAEAYVSDRILYQLGDEEIRGADEFFRRGSKLNLFAAVPQSSGAPPRSSYRRQRSVDSLLQDSSEGLRVSFQEGMTLATQADLGDLALAADLRRKQLHDSPGVSYIVDRNINYTNVCNVYCRFCAFYRAPETAGRPSKKSEGGYLLSKEQIGEKIAETVKAGGIQILLQGGLNPELGIEYYENLFRWIKANYPINLHALSADEILHICRVSNLSMDETFERLIAAGLGSFPGGGAELLVDRIRQRIARLKSPAAEWLECHRTAHRKGLRSSSTMLFGVQETWEDRILHMTKLRQLQDETGGFTAFITWPFQDENTQLKRGVTSSAEYLRVQSFARLYLDNISNIQSSWVTMGPSIGQAALYFGANDFGSVMFEENVVSAAGTSYCLDNRLLERHIQEAGFFPWRRDVHFRPSA